MALAVLCVTAVAPASVSAQDGLFGRFDGDVMVSAGLGGGAVFSREPTRGAGTFELRARYLDTAGLVLSATYAGVFDLSAAFELRPLFLALFFTNNSTGSEFLDLWVQSIGVELGASFAPANQDMGVSMLVGGGMEVPLVLPSTFGHGIFGRFAFRHRRGSPAQPAGPRVASTSWSVLFLISIHGVVDLGLASEEIARFRR